MKKIIMYTVLVMILIALVIIYFSVRAGNEAVYYQKLSEECTTKTSYSCCIASVNAMKSVNFILMPEQGCPEGYIKNMMKCIDSLEWCEPE